MGLAMHVSTRMRYGTRALAELAAAYPDRVVSVHELGKSQRISPKYLESIMCALRTAGLVESVRGSHGGYVLASCPSSIRLSDVYAALEGSAAPVACVDQAEACDFRDRCPTHETWKQVKAAVVEVLERTTLEDLADRQRRKAQVATRTYHI